MERKEILKDDEEDIIPDMKMDVMGLDYSAILARVRYINLLINIYIFYTVGLKFNILVNIFNKSYIKIC